MCYGMNCRWEDYHGNCTWKQKKGVPFPCPSFPSIPEWCPALGVCDVIQVALENGTEMTTCDRCWEHTKNSLWYQWWKVGKEIEELKVAIQKELKFLPSFAKKIIYFFWPILDENRVE